MRMTIISSGIAEKTGHKQRTPFGLPARRNSTGKRVAPFANIRILWQSQCARGGATHAADRTKTTRAKAMRK